MNIESEIESISHIKKKETSELNLLDAEIWLGKPRFFPLAPEIKAADLTRVLDDFSIEVEARQAEEHPKVFKEIKLRYVFTGKKLRNVDLERAIELSETKYCSVTAMLNKSVVITHDYEIVESNEARNGAGAG